MDTIYHITTATEWEVARKTGRYEAQSLRVEGFIHCCTKEQLEGVLQRYFIGRRDLVRLTLEPAQLTSRMVYELSPSVNENFPHVYGPINLDAVIDVEYM